MHYGHAKEFLFYPVRDVLGHLIPHLYCLLCYYLAGSASIWEQQVLCMLRFCIAEGLYLHDEMGQFPGWEAAGSILYHGRLGMNSGTGNG